MKIINFKDFPNTETPINADNLNTMQNNVNEDLTDLKNRVDNIVEINENENGIYIKYSNGLLECRTKLELTNQNTEFHYVSGVWTYPQEFVEMHGVQATVNNGTNDCDVVKVLAEMNSCNILVFSINPQANSFINNTSAFVNLIAYGKWK